MDLLPNTNATREFSTDIDATRQMCDRVNIVFVVSFILSVLLIMHHFYKHQNDSNLSRSERFFQPSDVFVLCTHGRFSHEIFVVVFFIIAIVMFSHSVLYCS